MRPRILIAGVVLLFWAVLTSAGDKDGKETEAEQSFAKIAQLGPGVYIVKKDAKGQILSCVAVGQSRISTVLGKAKGLEIARQRAQLAARAEFVKWLHGDKVTVCERTDDETIMLLEGKEGNEDALKESGKAVEKTSKKMESIASGMIRGMQTVHVDVNAEDKTYTLVLGWNAKTAQATKKASSINNPDSKRPESAPKVGDSGTTVKPKKPIDKKIKDKKVTSPDAKDFLR